MYLARDFGFVEMVDGADAVPDQTFLTELQLKAQQITTISNRTYFSEFTAATNTIVIASRGYSGSPIQLTVVLNASLDAVVSIERNIERILSRFSRLRRNLWRRSGH
ncbi:MAG: hypothetical protein MZU97_16825 [Bacillus subtilis]|nr:hypothetical protein [Bacillus subtilis]